MEEISHGPGDTLVRIVREKWANSHLTHLLACLFGKDVNV